jgi:hypothetical protein
MKYRGGKKKSFTTKKKNPGERLRKPMLNLGKLDYFKYDLNEIIDTSDIEDDLKPSFKASIIAKARQRSISDAKDYLDEMLEKEQVSEGTHNKLCRLLDRYTRVR